MCGLWGLFVVQGFCWCLKTQVFSGLCRGEESAVLMMRHTLVFLFPLVVSDS